MVTAPMITPSVLPPLLGIIATVNAYHTMLIIDKTRAAVQAHRRPFSSREATTNEITAKGINAAPSAMPNPGVEAWSGNRFRRGRSSMADSTSGCNKASWAINPIPKKSPATPTIMLTVAAIVTPRGRDLVALCISLSPPQCPPCLDGARKSTGTLLLCQR